MKKAREVVQQVLVIADKEAWGRAVSYWMKMIEDSNRTALRKTG